MNKFLKQFFAVLIGLVVGSVFLAVAFRGTPPESVLRLLRAGRWDWPAVVGLLGVASFVFAKTVRWRLLLGDSGHFSLPRLVRPVLSGIALNALVPHSGEFVRAVSLQRSDGLPLSGVLSSIVAERVFDLFGVLILGALALGFVTVSAQVATAVRLLGLVSMVLAIGIIIALALPHWIERFVGALTRWLPQGARDWIQHQLQAALDGLEPVRSLRTAARVLLWSLLLWVAVAVCVFCCGLVVGFVPTWPATCLVVVGIVVAFLLPNAPGYAGAVQVAFLVTLRPQGVSEQQALAASVVYQLLMILPLTAIGLACLRSTLARKP